MESRSLYPEKMDEKVTFKQQARPVNSASNWFIIRSFYISMEFLGLLRYPK